MSGKGTGKRHNRASQSNQHGFQMTPTEVARKPVAGKTGGTKLERAAEKQEVLRKVRGLENRNRNAGRRK